MSKQNEPLNILDEIFNDASPAGNDEPVLAVPSPQRKPKATKATTKPAPAKRTAKVQVPPEPPVPSSPKWEYMEVIFREFRGWRPRAVNGRERSDWKTAPIITEYLTTVGADGWELVSITDEHRNEKTAYFKRQR